MWSITSRFGDQESFRQKPHTGIDFSMENGTQIPSIKQGIIEKTVDYGNQNLGKGVFVKWEDGCTAIYGHLSKITVQEGQRVEQGDLLGYSGNTGFSTGAHLHFGLKKEGSFVDPSIYINDIQHMNELIAKKPSINDFLSSLSNIDWNNINANLIYIFSEMKCLLINHTVFAQYIQNFL
ncbi:M23 family metallopeptidase [Alkalihalobacillus sp. NPDC078783]